MPDVFNIKQQQREEDLLVYAMYVEDENGNRIDPTRVRRLNDASSDKIYDILTGKIISANIEIPLSRSYYVASKTKFNHLL